jgi:hypothetical protein
MVYQQRKYSGYLNVDVLNDGKTLTGRFYANDGSVLDQFTISKLTTSSLVGSLTTYKYEPSLALSGSNYEDVLYKPHVQLSKFSIAAWFNTSTNLTSTGFIVNKGGSGLETMGSNMNYGMWMTDSEKIGAGFETSNGTDFFVTSPNTYSDGEWHYAVHTYDGDEVIHRWYSGNR